MARAQSVGESEKGEVNCKASQSREGTECRGNLAACASGDEKSRQRRQEPLLELETLSRGMLDDI